MRPKTVLLMMAAGALGLWACAVTTPGGDPPPDKEKPLTAQEVIEKNLEAVGGRSRLKKIETLVLEGDSGSALLPPSEASTVYLKKPDLFRQESVFRIILCTGGRAVFNAGGSQSPLTGGDLEGLRYRIGFYHNACSLLKWERHFPSAQLEEVKRYGPARQYKIRLPAAEGGRDLIAYIDGETFLIDRLVYTITQEGARHLQVVNRLRDYQEFDGIRMPTRLVYDKVGWETSPTHFVIRNVQINPPLEDRLFESAEIDFGTVAREGETLRGEVLGMMDGSLLTNFRLEDLTENGFPLKSWIDLRVGDHRLEVKLLDNIQASATEIRPEEVYLCRYPISGFPRLMLMGFGVDVEARLPCKQGDTVILTRLERNGDPAGKEGGNEEEPGQGDRKDDEPTATRRLP